LKGTFALLFVKKDIVLIRVPDFSCELSWSRTEIFGIGTGKRPSAFFPVLLSLPCILPTPDSAACAVEFIVISVCCWADFGLILVAKRGRQVATQHKFLG